MFVVSACGGDKPGDNSNSAVVTNSTNQNQSKNGKSAHQLAPAAKLYDVGQEYLFTVMAREYWVFEHYVDKGVPSDKYYTGTWFHFNPDGTYTSGRWEEETGSGVWRLQYRDQQNFLDINSTNNDEDAEYAIKLNKDDTAASWTGTEMYPSHAQVMLKAIPLSSRPTKKQFHFKW